MVSFSRTSVARPCGLITVDLGKAQASQGSISIPGIRLRIIGTHLPSLKRFPALTRDGPVSGDFLQWRTCADNGRNRLAPDVRDFHDPGRRWIPYHAASAWGAAVCSIESSSI